MCQPTLGFLICNLQTLLVKVSVWIWADAVPGRRGSDLEGKVHRCAALLRLWSYLCPSPNPSLYLYGPRGQKCHTILAHSWGVFATLIFLKNSYMGWKVCLSLPNLHTGTQTHIPVTGDLRESRYWWKRKQVIQVYMHLGREQASCHGLGKEVTERRKEVRK